MSVFSNEPQIPLTHHVGTAADRHPVAQCSIGFCGIAWAGKPGTFDPGDKLRAATEEPRFGLSKPGLCKHGLSRTEVRPDFDLFPQHFFDCLRPEQQRVVMIDLMFLTRIGAECRQRNHEGVMADIGTDAGVDAAIRASHKADGNEGLITGWVVLASVSNFGDDGTQLNGVHRMFPDGSLPWVQALGIVEAARIQMHRDYANGEA